MAKRKYIKLICTHCGGDGWNWGTLPEHAHYSPTVQGTDKITCSYCHGTGIYKAEIVEEKK